MTRLANTLRDALPTIAASTRSRLWPSRDVRVLALLAGVVDRVLKYTSMGIDPSIARA